MAEISVIVPVYKVERHLDRCVNSIVEQSFEDLEIILVDDGSPDGCPAMCDRWALKDSRIRVIHKTNGGLSSARNAGLEAMTGSYVFFIDSDDEIVPEALRILYDIVTKNDCDMAFGRFLRVSDRDLDDICLPPLSAETAIFDEKAFWDKYYESFFSKTEQEMSVNMVVSWGKLIKAAVINGLRFEEGKIHEDEFFIHRLIGGCTRTAFIDSVLHLYYQNPDGIMAKNESKSRTDALEAYGDRVAFFAERNKPNALRSFEFFYYIFLRYFKKADEDKKLKSRLLKIYRSTVRAAAPVVRSAAPVDMLLYRSLYLGPSFYNVVKKSLSVYASLKER